MTAAALVESPDISLALNGNGHGPTSPSPAARITEVVARDFPEDGYEYRGVIRSCDAGGATLLEQTLQTRRKPEWLVNVRHEGGGSLEFTLLSRRFDTRSWQRVGQADLQPQEKLGGESSVVASVPLPGWDQAPQMHLHIRLSDAPPEKAQALTRPRPRQAAQNAHARDAAPTADETTLTLAEIAATAPLTPVDEIIVKDAWNKLLAFQDLLVEMFFERLLHEEPDLADAFGDAIDNVPYLFAEMFDVCLRGLNLRTERSLREGYRGVYPTPLDGYKTVEEYATLLADLGMRPRHWMTARRVWAWMLPHVPYLEEYDREDLAKGMHSATYRFFTRHVLPPALSAIAEYDQALTPEIIAEMRRCGDILAADASAVGMDFYRFLFETHPDVIPYFGRTDVDALAGHLMQAVAFLVRSVEAGHNVLRELRELGRIHAHFGVPPEAYPKIVGPMMAIMHRHVPDFTPELEHAWGILLTRVVHVLVQPMVNRGRLLGQAREFLELIAKEQEWEQADLDQRWGDIQREVGATGTYTQTYEELAYGAQVAWRNSAKCIARIAWRNMIVRDLRHVSDPDEMFRECIEHVRMGTNGGNLQIVMNVFRPKKPGERWGPRIWNSQYLRFAAYENPDGTILGDPGNLGLTKAITRQGWTPPAEKTPFDVLPLVIETPGQAPKRYELPPEDVRIVDIEHPTIPGFATLGLKWCTIPAISNFRMEVGGINYGCIPFNGWFMGTEIARNLWEPERYDKAEAIAGVLGLDTSSEQTLWRDRAFLELNTAILHSFAKAKISLVDHQTAARQFLSHDQREKRAGREVPAQWSWVVPPAGGSTTAVWHHEMRDFYLSPQYHYAADKWAVVDEDLTIPGEDGGMEEAVGGRIVILYGSETGTAEGFARQAARRLSRFRPRVMAMNEYNADELRGEQMALVVTSTFGDGSVPGNGRKFLAWLQGQPGGSLDGLSFSVMALGSTIYPHFCAAGALLDRELARAGGDRAVALHRGDEIKGQAETFRQWLDLVARLLGEDPTSADAAGAVRLGVSFLDPTQVPADAGLAWKQKRTGHEAPVVANRELLKEVIAGSRSTRFMAFDIAATGLTYETGDHVAIYPHNPAALVERVCGLIGVDPDAWFTTALVDRAGKSVGDGGDTAYPAPVQVRRVLAEDFDLSLRDPFADLLTAMLGAAGDARDKETLGAWLDTLKRGEESGDCRALKAHVLDNFVTVADLLAAFPSAKLGLEHLIELLPKQKPRLYSISSCSLLHPQQIHVTIGVLQVTTGAGKTRQGLCSNYLAPLDPAAGATVRLAVHTSSFRPPTDLNAPVLLVGPGTGLSPLIGFLQHRELQMQAAGGPGGHARLYFGCRNNSDYLYQQELESWREKGVLTHLDIAFSRLGEDKVYVQHRIGQQGVDQWAALSQPSCRYYVCGDAKMANDVFYSLMSIAKTEGGLSHAEAVEFFRVMQEEGRYVTDVWGVLLNFQAALAETQEANYSQGERWLKRMTAGATAS